MSSFNCFFLTCIQVSQEAGQVVWYSCLFKNFPQFIVIHIVKGFGIVNKAEIDVFLELFCFFDDPADVGNSISGSSAFSKSSLNIWKFTVHILLKPGLENFEHYFTSMWDECNSAVVWAFFGIAFLRDCLSRGGPYRPTILRALPHAELKIFLWDTFLSTEMRTRNLPKDRKSLNLKVSPLILTFSGTTRIASLVFCSWSWKEAFDDLVPFHPPLLPQLRPHRPSCSSFHRSCLLQLQSLHPCCFPNLDNPSIFTAVFFSSFRPGDGSIHPSSIEAYPRQNIGTEMQKTASFEWLDLPWRRNGICSPTPGE